MKTATVKELKTELSNCKPIELLQICLRLSKFKKENKELLTYLLFEASNEAQYIENVKIVLATQFSEVNTKSYYYIKKSVRKILRNCKKYIRYSQKKETEVDLLIYFCTELKKIRPSMVNSVQLHNIYKRQLKIIRNTVSQLHEDLQFDYNEELNELDL
ncbi:MAG: hypothetical protein MK207_00035 [Saprospiraceae bacterium]|nr:hypothetical protein [Saprospiraceae bacterium]